MKKLYLIIIAILIVIILSLLDNRKNYKPVRINNYRVDTVYKPYQVTKPYKEETPIKHVTVYSEGVKRGTDIDSLIHLRIEPTKLSLTILKDSDLAIDQEYSINPSLYKYNFSNGILTQKRIYQIKPYAELKIRPINNMYDLEGGISYKTKHFTYKLGIDLGYYPSLTNKPQKDLMFTVQWQR